jgi:hypothetical protein
VRASGNHDGVVKLYTLCFILFAAFIAGPAWIPYKLYDPATAAAGGLSDSLDYLALADNQFVDNPVHRYRVFEPLIVRMFARAHPRQGFFILNVALTAPAATCLLAMLLESVPLTVALLSSLVFLGGRDVIEATGAPMIDPSLYLLIAGCFLALKKQSRWALSLTLLLAPTIKENGWFLFPLIFLFGSLSTTECTRYGALGILVALAVRESVDLHFGGAMSENIAASVQHLRNVTRSDTGSRLASRPWHSMDGVRSVLADTGLGLSRLAQAGPAVALLDAAGVSADTAGGTRRLVADGYPGFSSGGRRSRFHSRSLSDANPPQRRSIGARGLISMSRVGLESRYAGPR